MTIAEINKKLQYSAKALKHMRVNNLRKLEADSSAKKYIPKTEYRTKEKLARKLAVMKK